MARHLAANMLTLLIVGALVLAGAIGWGRHEFTRPGPLTEPVFFEVPRGASLRAVSEDLAEAGAIGNATIFRLGADYAGRASDLKFGSYELPAGASMAEILDMLTEGGAGRFRYVAEFVIGVAGAETRLTERTPGTGETEVLASFAPGDPLPEVWSALLADGRAPQERDTARGGEPARRRAAAAHAAGGVDAGLDHREGNGRARRAAAGRSGVRQPAERGDAGA